MDPENQTTPAPEAPETAPEAAEAPTPQEESFNEVAAAMRGETAKSAEPPAPKKPELTAVPGGKKEAAPAPAPAPNTEMELLRQQVAALQSQLQTRQAPAAAPAAPAPAASPYSVNIPAQLAQAFASGDPNQVAAAMQHYTAGIGALIEETILKKVSEEVLPKFQEQVYTQLDAKEQYRQIENDFYSTHAELNHPAIRPLVGQIANSIYQQNPGLQWSPVVRDHIANQVKAILSQYQAPQQVAPAPAPGISQGGQPARRGPVLTPLGTRPSAGALRQPSQADEAFELFNTGR